MEIIADSPAGMEAVADQLIEYAGERRIFAFTGEIGAGKTTLIQAFCRHFGVEEAVTSPTFALVNEYEGMASAPEDVPVSIYHLDLYRLEDLEEALDIGIEEILDSGAYVLIEWPDLIEPLLPEGTIRIKIEILDNSRRKVLFL